VFEFYAVKRKNLSETLTAPVNGEDPVKIPAFSLSLLHLAEAITEKFWKVVDELI
jgi:hypothetical protein